MGKGLVWRTTFVGGAIRPQALCAAEEPGASFKSPPHQFASDHVFALDTVPRYIDALRSALQVPMQHRAIRPSNDVFQLRAEPGRFRRVMPTHIPAAFCLSLPSYVKVALRAVRCCWFPPRVTHFVSQNKKPGGLGRAKLLNSLVARGRIELPTRGFSVPQIRHSQALMLDEISRKNRHIDYELRIRIFLVIPENA